MYLAVNKKITILFLLLWLVPLKTEAAEIAIIIDDMGNTRKDAAAFTLPKEVAFSILPMKRLTKAFAQKAAEQKREIMVHIPMEALAGNRLGPGAIMSGMRPQAIRQVLEMAIDSVPQAIGVNNHMGSKLTQLTLPMSTMMDFLQEKSLFFVDSRTTRFSKAEEIARQKGVMSTKRNVFLDHVREPQHIDQQFKRLLRLARKYSHAVAIAHPYPETVDYLQQALPKLAEHNIRLVNLSEIVQSQYIASTSQGDKSDAAALD